MKFHEATVEHLVRKKYDHNPILIRCNNAMVYREGRPFRFQALWFTHKDYLPLVKDTWSTESGSIVRCLQSVAQKSIDFNKNVFGNIFARKKEVEARLRGIQRALENIDSANLLRLQKELLAEYENILFQEETLWFQKSGEQWIKLGSRNTSFFHAQSVIRRKRNKIHGIEIDFIKIDFKKGYYDPKVCETFIVLLPKGESQRTFKDFRPISLCNVAYKLISKIIMARLRPFLDEVVSPLHNSFIPGRSTKDNAIVLQEVLHFMKKSKRKNGDMVFKLDLEKAYDRANWRFLRDTLTKFNFPPRITSLIMFDITSASNTPNPSHRREVFVKRILSRLICLSFVWNVWELLLTTRFMFLIGDRCR
jgi:hypothetical protein